MNRLFTLFIAGAVAALAAALLLANLAHAGPPTPTTDASGVVLSPGDEPPQQPQVGSSRRISIPFGIASPLPLLAGRSQVAVHGHGGCPLGEVVTIVISMTQSSSGASATGGTVQDCTGLEETYQLAATAVTSATFEPGPAEACGVATMRLGEEVMEVEEWCRAEPALLVELDQFVYLPLVVRGTAE